MRLGLTRTFSHLDTTSFHVDGRYNSAQPPDGQVVHSTQGYSRDHRPGLHQVLLELVVEHQAGIPVLMQPLSGNSHDGKAFGQVISDHIAQLHTTAHPTYLVADSALYSAENLQKLAQTSLKWITRVPATLQEAQAVLTQADPQTMAPLTEGYRYHVVLGPSARGPHQREAQRLALAPRGHKKDLGAITPAGIIPALHKKSGQKSDAQVNEGFPASF